MWYVVSNVHQPVDSGHVYDGFLLFLSSPGPPLFSLGWSLWGINYSIKSNWMV